MKIILILAAEIWISGKGTDDFGFNALPGGFYDDSFFFYGTRTPFTGKGELVAFWSATGDISRDSGNMRAFKYNQTTLNLVHNSINSRYDMAYVRCVKD
jgi:uncharacterized protein (TIGR02145 family)